MTDFSHCPEVKLWLYLRILFWRYVKYNPQRLCGKVRHKRWRLGISSNKLIIIRLSVELDLNLKRR